MSARRRIRARVLFAHWSVDAAHTSCEFGANVAAVVTKTLQSRMSDPPSVVVLVGVPSPKTPVESMT